MAYNPPNYPKQMHLFPFENPDDAKVDLPPHILAIIESLPPLPTAEEIEKKKAEEKLAQRTSASWEKPIKASFYYLPRNDPANF